MDYGLVVTHLGCDDVNMLCRVRFRGTPAGAGNGLLTCDFPVFWVAETGRPALAGRPVPGSDCPAYAVYFRHFLSFQVAGRSAADLGRG
jgi:hypothetical protein